jgi:hypothetical protein
MNCSVRTSRLLAPSASPVPQWQQQIEAIAKLPKARQRFVTEMLQTVLAQH